MFAAGGWLSLGGLWVVVPETMVVCLVAAATSTSVVAYLRRRQRRPMRFTLGYAGLAVFGIALISLEVAYSWEFVWPLSLAVLVYGQVTALLLGAVLVLAN